MKTFSTEPLGIPCTVKVHTDYDALDAKAEKQGYENHGNDPDFCGWMKIDDPDYQMREANRKLTEAQKKFGKAVIALCMTGHFSVGYTIYTKNKAHHTP